MRFRIASLTGPVRIIAVAAIPFIPVAVNAQHAGSDIRIDIQRSRLNAILSLPSLSPAAIRPLRTARALAALEEQPPGPEKPFTFDITAPLFFNSNALQSQLSPTGALEGSPDLSIGWEHQFKSWPIKLSASLDVNADRFANVKDASLDTVSGAFRIQYVDPLDDQGYQPFVEYAPTVAFAPTFSRSILTIHDVSIGVDKVFNFTGDFRRNTDGGTTPALSLGFTAKLQRRSQDVGANSYALWLVPSATRVFSEQWSVSLEVDIIGRWYDRNAGFSQRDWTINPRLVAEFSPPKPWFGDADGYTAFGKPVIDFQLAFANVSSNKSGAGFNQWIVGPAIKATWKF